MRAVTEVSSMGPRNSFRKSSMHVCVCVSSFENNIKHSKGLAGSHILNWDWNQKNNLPSLMGGITLW